MRVSALLALPLGVAACSDGLISCPPGTPSAGVCVPSTIPWCSSIVWRNPYASTSSRVADVLPRLTLQEKVNLLQTTPVNASEVPRLGIFRTGTAECLHGYCARAPSTVFPQSTTLAASFNAPLLREVAAAVGMEARAWRNEWVANGSDYNASPFPSLTCFAPQINSASGAPPCARRSFSSGSPRPPPPLPIFCASRT